MSRPHLWIRPALTLRLQCGPTIRPLISALFLMTAGIEQADAFTQVRLFWRTETPSVQVGDIIDIGLYARSNGPGDSCVIGFEMGFAWDQPVPPNYPAQPVPPTHLQFLGIDNAGGVADPNTWPVPADWSELIFPDFCQANESNPPEDGSGSYYVMGGVSPNAGIMVPATTEGILLTTFHFRALAATESARVEILIWAGRCLTRGFDCAVPGYNSLDHNGYGAIDLRIEGQPGPPQVAVQPPDRLVCRDMSTRLDLVVTGTPPFAYRWRKEGVDIAGAAQWAYRIAAVQPDDAGVYDCVVSNALGTITTAPIALAVDAPLIITRQPIRADACVGGRASFEVAADGPPPLQYQWRRDSVLLAGATGPVLVIDPIAFAASGSYSVTVSADCGSITSQAASLVVRSALPADVNGDRRVNGGDIAAFVGILLQLPGGPASASFCAADLNADGVVNTLDMTQFVTRLLAYGT